jgi:hypothetical protein
MVNKTKITLLAILILAAFCVVTTTKVSALYGNPSDVSGSGSLFDTYSPSGTSVGEANPTIVVTVTPPNPRPGDSVTIELSSTWTNLNQAEIAWTENGAVTESGTGKTKYFVTAGAIGNVTRVTAAVKTAEGQIYEYPVNVRPATVDVIWESDSTVPPF